MITKPLNSIWKMEKRKVRHDVQIHRPEIERAGRISTTGPPQTN